jgi:hypothetical protein
MLFNIVANMLAIMIECAKVVGLIEGVILHLVDGGLSILFTMPTIQFSSWIMILRKQEI